MSLVLVALGIAGRRLLSLVIAVSLRDVEKAWETLGESIRQRREDLGLTQEQAAVSAEVSTAIWRIVETAARTNVKRSNLRSICRVLNWTPDSYELILAGGAPAQVVDGGTLRLSASGGPQSLDGKFDQLNVEDRATVERLVDRLLGNQGGSD